MTTAAARAGRRLVELDGKLTQRERALLGSLAKLRLACTRQLEALHFTASTPLSNARQARRVLAKLAELGLVSRLERRVGGVRAGSAGYVWSLGKAGQALVTGRGPAGGPKMEAPWTPSRAFLAHRLTVSALYVELVQAERNGRLEIMHFDAEPAAWRSFNGVHGVPVTLKPDAYVQLGLGEYLDAYFVEVDLATESPQVLARKLSVYRSYLSTGREQARNDGIFPRVLFLVPTPARANVVSEVIGRQPSDLRNVLGAGLLTQAINLLSNGGEL